MRPRSLDALFKPAVSLESSDGLRLLYRLLPWKRHVITVCYRPESLSGYVVSLAHERAVIIDVIRAREALLGRYRVAPGAAGVRLVRTDLVPGLEEHALSLPLDELAKVRAAHLRAGSIRFGLVLGELRFEVSGFVLDELAPRFSALYPLSALGLPSLFNREWAVSSPEKNADYSIDDGG